MGDEHDAWMKGIGVDVESVLRTAGSAFGDVDAVAGIRAAPSRGSERGVGRGGVREIEQEDRRPSRPAGTQKGDPEKSAVFSAKTTEGDEAELLSEESEVREDGSVAGKGSVLRVKKGDEEGEILSGEFEVGEDAVSGKGALLRSRKSGQADTIGEVEVSKTKAAVVGIKRETDFAVATGLLPEGVVAKGDAALGTASIETSSTDKGISVGAQANVGEGSLTFGTSGTKQADGTTASDRDETSRVGLSAGGGAAGRIHFGDEDKDGNREFGVGADIGPASFDLKSEDPLRTAVSTLAPFHVSIALGLTDDGSNLTKEAIGPPEERIKEVETLLAEGEELLLGDED